MPTNVRAVLLLIALPMIRRMALVASATPAHALVDGAGAGEERRENAVHLP